MLVSELRCTGFMLLDILKNFLAIRKVKISDLKGIEIILPDLWEHSTGLKIDDEKVLQKTAKNLAELHQAGFPWTI